MSKSIEDYQVVINGVTKPVSDLSKEELQQEVVKLMDVLEAIDCQTEAMDRLMKAYRHGTPVPTDLEPRP